MSDCRFGVSPVNYPDPDPDPVLIMVYRMGDVFFKTHVINGAILLLSVGLK